MNLRKLILLGFFLGVTAAKAEDDLAPLSDEFHHAGTVANWRRIHQVEGWGNDVLEEFNINTARVGRLFMAPYSSTWYAENRGDLTFKEVAGDFVITTEVEPTRRSGSGAPRSEYSLAGIMVRTPRTMASPAQWTPGGQNYIFLSLGAASNPGSYQFEVKTTINSQSTLHITDNAPPRAMIQVARLGPHLITLRSALGGNWEVHRRYQRGDMPTRLQAGLTVYTDWPLCSEVGFENQNTRVLTNGTRLANGSIVSGANPDLLAAFDYVRYRRPQIPPNLAGANFSNPSAVSDAQLLSFLGANANLPHMSPPRITAPSVSDHARWETDGLPLRVQAAAGLSCTLQASTDLEHWADLDDFSGTGVEIDLVDRTFGDHPHRHYRVRINP